MEPIRWPAPLLVVCLLVATSFVLGLPSRAQPISPPRPVARPASSAQVRLSSDPDLDLILQRAADYVAGFFGAFSAAVAEEEYVQTAFRSDFDPAAVAEGNTGRRVLRSDFLLVRRPDNNQLMPFRDVFEVDGRPVRDRQDRLERLFLEKPATAMGDASRITEESARYNIGPIDRTVNVPTLPLQFLQRSDIPRFEFKKGKQESVNGLPVWRITYTEKTRPTLIRRRGGDDVPAEGAFWIDAASGTVARTRLRVGLPRDPRVAQPLSQYWREETGRAALDAEFVVTYRANEVLGVWLPAEMKETYLHGERTINATATYSNFRRFRVTTEETIKVPKR